MPTIIMTKWAGKLDGSIKAKAMTFLQKLAADDASPGLHVEPIQKAADPRVRTGRVDLSYRAVMFRLDGNDETHYVIHGVWPHDEAIAIATRTRLTVNPVNGLPVIEDAGAATVVTHPEPANPVKAGAATMEDQRKPEPLLPRLGLLPSDLVDRLGLPADVAAEAIQVLDEDAMLSFAQPFQDSWIGMILIDLATGDSVESIIERLELEASPTSGEDDVDVLAALKRPAAAVQFAFIEDQEELRQVIESGDFGAWRVFLHPEQRRYVSGSYGGPFRLSGGAGTGKTVVLIHRARHLALRDPSARIILTTFTTNLADALKEATAQLDPRIPLVGLGNAGVHVTGIDALAAAVLRSAGPQVQPFVHAVLGEDRDQLAGRTSGTRWREVLDSASTTLPTQIANESFLSAEYSTVILPQRIRSAEEYLRVRRPGRGIALDRGKRLAVWSLVQAYRAQGRVDGTVDFAEAASIAAAYLEGADGTSNPLADHVLVDEGQDLLPSHWQLLRAVAAVGSDDLFIAEDSHQRIYGPRVVLSRYGISIVGRSRRLTLNYRTTAQNLRYAVGVLDGGRFVDIEDLPEQQGYRSARTGPEPRLIDTPTITAELDTVAEILRGWLADGVIPETVAVLVHDRRQRDRIASGLGERGIAVRPVDRERPGSGRPLVMTMHRAKGTEFSKLVLVGVGAVTDADRARLAALDDSDIADSELRERSLLYVAATRARDELVVLHRR